MDLTPHRAGKCAGNNTEIMKEIWSNRYGKNPKEGLHKWLIHNVRGYKRSHFQKYIDGFAAYLGREGKNDSVDLVSGNFEKWKTYVKNKTAGAIP